VEAQRGNPLIYRANTTGASVYDNSIDNVTVLIYHISLKAPRFFCDIRDSYTLACKVGGELASGIFDRANLPTGSVPVASAFAAFPVIFGTAFPAPFAAPAFARCAIMIRTSGIQVDIADETDKQGAYYD
jgi:hypothetical protein